MSTLTTSALAPGVEKPLVVCIGARSAAAAVDHLRREGWLVESGWSLSCREWDVSAARVVCEGRLECEAHAQGALLAAVRGAGIVAVAEEGGDWNLLARFFEDLARLGPVQVSRLSAMAGRPVGLGRDEQRLLELLATGTTLGEAAQQLHLSRRTADRRLARARTALGVETTAEAVVAFRRDRGGTSLRVA